MIFDKPEHKQIVIELINNSNFSGKLVELVLDLKQAVLKAEVQLLPKEEKND